ncbi:MAG: hypothetical protein VX341_02755 [Bdellovibrionota bacterium]|nr:hypothetical protein [Bdellovibrionota bacterium]
MRNKLIFCALIAHLIFAKELIVGGKKIRTGHKLNLLETKSSEITPELIELQENNKELQNIINKNANQYKKNPEQLKKIKAIISKNDAKIKKLRFDKNHLEYKENKDEKALVYGFASFLDSCGASIDGCKNEETRECRAQYEKSVLFKKQASSKKECLQFRKDLIRSKDIKVISSGNFKDDLTKNKLINYYFGNESIRVSEVNNCILVATKNGHDRDILNTHSESKAQCQNSCKEEYLRSYKSYQDGAISCHYMWTDENDQFLLIAKKDSDIFKIWTDLKLNPNLDNKTTILSPMFDKNNKFISFKKISGNNP